MDSSLALSSSCQLQWQPFGIMEPRNSEAKEKVLMMEPIMLLLDNLLLNFINVEINLYCGLSH